MLNLGWSSIESSKGKSDLIGYLFLWAFSVIIGVVLAFAMGFADDLSAQELAAEFDQSNNQEYDSMMNMFIYGNMSEHNNVESDYNDESFYRVLSQYLSTENEVRIGEENLDPNRVKEDMDSYVSERARFLPRGQSFGLRVVDEDESFWLGDQDSRDIPLVNHYLVTESGNAVVTLYVEDVHDIGGGQDS